MCESNGLHPGPLLFAAASAGFFCLFFCNLLVYNDIDRDVDVFIRVRTLLEKGLCAVKLGLLRCCTGGWVVL